jgi:hypothetical protein
MPSGLLLLLVGDFDHGKTGNIWGFDSKIIQTSSANCLEDRILALLFNIHVVKRIPHSLSYLIKSVLLGKG